MPDPISAIAIVSLAVTPFLNTEAGKASVGKIAEKLTEATLKKMHDLWMLVSNKLNSKQLPEVDAVTKKAQEGNQVAIEEVAKYIEHMMEADEEFANEVQNLTQEIQQEITIQQGIGNKVYNVFGGKVEENIFNENKAPIIKDNTGTVNFNWGSASSQ